MFGRKPRDVNPVVKDKLSGDIKRIVDQSRDQLHVIDEDKLMQGLVIFIVERDHKIATTFYKRGQEEPKA